MKDTSSIASLLHRATLFFISILLIICPQASHASVTTGNTGSVDDLAKTLLALVVILIAAKLGGDIFVRIGQPAVLGELIFGIIIGNLNLLGFNAFDFIKYSGSIKILSEIGVVLLLFQVGLESDLVKMMKVGASSFLVATLGVIAPFLLGWGVATIFLPNDSVYTHLFIGATLCATSVGITARVLLDLGKLQTAEARIILGAAVIDDVMGLVILAVVSGVIGSVSSGGDSLSIWAIMLIVAKATLFFAGSLVLGRWLASHVFQIAARFKASEMMLTTALGLCFLFAYLSSVIGLAPIVGAFAAGLILDEVHWRSFRERGEHSIEELIKPLTALLVPIFFVRMGAEVDLTKLMAPSVLGFAAVLTAVAIIGKQICGMGVLERGLDRISIGIGMIPRGEVGLIFAAIGSKMIYDGKPVVEQATFSVIVIMVVVTTMITPPILKWSMGRSKNS